MRRKILTATFTVIALGMGGYLFHSIYQEVRQIDEITKIEAKVINKLQVIRTAQQAYRSVYGRYAGDWDSLTSFIEEGMLFIIERKEEVFVLDYGADSIVITLDTLGSIRVIDSLFSSSAYENYDFRRLAYAPHSPDEQFLLYVGKIERSGVLSDIIEVKDPSPVDRKRREENKARTLKPLHFGSKEEVSLTGNWE